MKPFDLEAAKRGEPIQTRDGRKAQFVAHVPDCSPPHRVIALIEFSPKISDYYETGEYEKDKETHSDLFMAPKKRTVWVNFYNYADQSAFYHDSEQAADRAAGGVERVGNRAYPVEIEE